MEDRRLIIILLIIVSIAITLFLTLHNKASPKISINTCSVEALESLPDIGPVLADRIIQGRPYDDVWSLDRVKGIGPATIEAIEGMVTE